MVQRSNNLGWIVDYPAFKDGTLVNQGAILVRDSLKVQRERVDHY